MNPPVNVAHLAGPNGQCTRCHAGIGCFMEMSDETNTWTERPWKEGERVLEYECSDGRTRFANVVTGFSIDCQP
jgi:hypothetical protein